MALSPKLLELARQENLRIQLCYGKEKPLKEVQEAIKIFFDIKQEVEAMINEEK